MAKFFSAILIIIFTTFTAAQSAPPNQTLYGPVVTAHLTNLAEELNELEYQIQHQEISRVDYTRSRQRLLLQKQFVEQRAKISGEDNIPEMQILTADEINRMIGVSEAKNQPWCVDDILADKWKINRIEKRAERFFILERVAPENAGNARPKPNPLDVIETIVVSEPDLEEEAQARLAAAPKPQAPRPPTQPQPQVAVIPRPTIHALFLPAYTTKAREKKIEGKVVLHAVFTHDGKIKDLEVAQKLGYGLDESALEAAKKLTFAPALIEGQAVNIQANIIYLFTLTHTSASVQPVAVKGGQH